MNWINDITFVSLKPFQLNIMTHGWRQWWRHTPCSRAFSCSLAATPPITSSSLCQQIDKRSILAFRVKHCLHLLVHKRDYKMQSYLSFGFSTYFLNCLTLLRVCSASSLDGSMIRALGPLDNDFSWLILALPAQTQRAFQHWREKFLDCYNVFVFPSAKMFSKVRKSGLFCEIQHEYQISYMYLYMLGFFFAPVWEDLTVCPSTAWSKATNPLLGAFLNSSPPKLNFSSAFCKIYNEKDNWIA